MDGVAGQRYINLWGMIITAVTFVRILPLRILENGSGLMCWLGQNRSIRISRGMVVAIQENHRKIVRVALRKCTFLDDQG